jgi:hypothetical protein
VPTPRRRRHHPHLLRPPGRHRAVRHEIGRGQPR